MTLIPVTRETLGQKRLKPQTSFAPFATSSTCEIVASEFGAIATAYPIFFIERDGAFVPFALLGLSGTDNLFIEANGGWSGGYMPGMMRTYPFKVQLNEQGQPTLYLDDEQGQLSDDEGDALFGADEASDQSSVVGRVLQTISALEMQVTMTRTIMAKIAESGILKSITIPLDASEADRPIGGLYAINETALNELSDDALIALRKAGALVPIYAHLVSLGQVQGLKARSRFRRALSAAAATKQ